MGPPCCLGCCTESHHWIGWIRSHFGGAGRADVPMGAPRLLPLAAFVHARPGCRGRAQLSRFCGTDADAGPSHAGPAPVLLRVQPVELVERIAPRLRRGQRAQRRVDGFFAGVRDEDCVAQLGISVPHADAAAEPGLARAAKGDLRRASSRARGDASMVRGRRRLRPRTPRRRQARRGGGRRRQLLLLPGRQRLPGQRPSRRPETGPRLFEGPRRRPFAARVQHGADAAKRL
mmetsp:Transcript_24479/g.84513  ORF Transcript_24479/g.84513 Transcript_24479/m.84513 type:complete len:232 (+) Transcript_24479:1873-2568(+)